MTAPPNNQDPVRCPECECLAAAILEDDGTRRCSACRAVIPGPGDSDNDGTNTGGGETGPGKGDATGTVSDKTPSTNRYKARKRAPSELRLTAKEDGLVTLDGWASLTEVNYLVYDAFGAFTERLARGAWDHAVQNADCRFLFNHSGLPLARTTSNTLQVQSTSRGLHSSARLDPEHSTAARDLVAAIDRGDVTQMSCGFRVADDVWSEDFDARVIYKIAELLDVSPVTYPASPTTSITVARSADPDAEARRRRALAERRRREIRIPLRLTRPR